MLRVALLLCLITITIGLTTEKSFAERLDKLYEKLEKLTAPNSKLEPNKLYAKLDRFNSLSPDHALSEDEELLSAMQLWGGMSEEQLRGLVREFQEMKEERSEKIIEDYKDDWTDDDDGDYANDDAEEWDPIEDEISSTSKPLLNLGVTPSAFTRLDGYRHTIVSAVDPIAATNERPRILDDSQATPEERREIRKAVITNMGTVVRAAKCLIPQPRWLTVRKLAPAADTVYMPPCVQLHRCAPDSGCCYNEAEVCAPVDGKYVAISFFLSKADGNLTASRILFFNHTRCACVSKDTLQSTARTRIDRVFSDERRESKERQNDWRATEEPRLERDEEQTSPPQMRRCTCPRLFRSQITDGACYCVCDWPDATRRRECLSLARGREHFGLRDRVCVAQGNCNAPTCEYGAYERHSGRCPLRRYKRRFHVRSRYNPEKTV
ncbi:uncharacterized protein LOC123709025 isoform X1 [Pieris brassicae]|uniref:uncharacterized protein LOC123709025 isoform X1 n=1 Tax=Pieris brassicae TaxID=7116 RepID=UPI001E661CF4|nr:uncharacterized protein LOC123709025 isoform X1 [Pieris brassicae]